MASGRAAWATRRLGSVQARRSCACVAVSRATGGAPTYASRPRPTPVRDRLPACALSLVMRLVQAFEAVFLFGFRFARPTRERRGRYAGFFPGIRRSARLRRSRSRKHRVASRFSHVRHGTPIQHLYHWKHTEAHTACNTVKHETAVVASFNRFRHASTHRAPRARRETIGPRPAPAPAIGMQRV